ncbi:hypothetical protein SUGI_0121500 [Cryptomeria japonica]|uniref:uncharacterized protein LOC131071377 n=1 Tax=Cryptomeria japonica TaxID=3369 RepID=UPI002408CFFC|nr:uncharacterized protein LOC131071377 [Cryptomeria japonica]GLJ10074.1 hypothetical protein SUGI_0121500 [Cryptomeria japonica]
MALLEFENGWQSSRISFSVDLSPIDMASPEKRKRSDVADMNYSTEFEFFNLSSHVNHGCDADKTESLISADELFVDGKILPQIRAPEALFLSNDSHASPESSSPARSESSSLSKTSGLENDECKSARWPSSRWKKIFKLSNNDHFRPAVDEADQILNEGKNDVKNRPSGRSRWPFSWSGGEKRGSSLFCALPFSRSKSAAERKSKPCCEASSYRSISFGAEFERKILLSGSKPFGTSSSKREDFMKPPDLTKRKGNQGRVLTNSPSRYYSRGSPGRKNQRFMVRNSKGLASGGSIGMSMRVSPVVNMPALGMRSFGGQKKGSGIFGFVSRNNRKPSHCPNCRMKSF